MAASLTAPAKEIQATGTKVTKLIDHTVPPVRMAGRPRTVVCYLCGREFGTQSIGIHEPQCLKKWQQENDQLPKSQRRPVPQKPQIEAPVAGSGTGTYNLDNLNEAAFQAAMDNRVACKNCGRRFNPDRLPVHMQSCRKR